jgi:selenide,water dikinase
LSRGGGHSIDDPEPKYGLAVTGTADPAALLRIDAGRPGLPLSLTKPIGSGVLNAWHKATGQVSPAAVEVMTTLNAEASRAALAAGIGCATDITGFGLLGHLFKLARASGVSAVVDHAAVPLIDGTRAAARAGHMPAAASLNWARMCRPARCGLDCCLAMPDKRARYWPVLNGASLSS